MIREGGRHSWRRNNRNGRRSAIPRYREIDDLLARKICRDLGSNPPSRGASKVMPVTGKLREEQPTSGLNAKLSTVHGNGATPGNMVRRILSDSQWARVASLLPGKDGDPGRSARDNREFLEAVLWMARTGTPWRDLPDEFGLWNSVFQRFRRWARKGVFERVFKELSADADFEYVLIDGTIVRLHQHGAGAKGGAAAKPSVARAGGGQARRSA